MFRYDNEWTENDWRYEADASALVDLDRDRRDMEEYPPPLTAMEAAEDRAYLAIGGLFADDAGPIGMNLESQPARRKKAA